MVFLTAKHCTACLCVCILSVSLIRIQAPWKQGVRLGYSFVPVSTRELAYTESVFTETHLSVPAFLGVMEREEHYANFLQRKRAQPSAFFPNSSEVYKCTMTFSLLSPGCAKPCEEGSQGRLLSLSLKWKNTLEWEQGIWKGYRSSLGVPLPGPHRLTTLRSSCGTNGSLPVCF